MAEPTRDFRIPGDLPPVLPIIPLRRGVLLTGAVQPFSVGRALSNGALNAAQGTGWIIVGVQHDPKVDPSPADLLTTGTLSRIIDVRTAGADGGRVVILQGIARVTLQGITQSRPHFEARWESAEQPWPETTDAVALARTFRDTVSEMAALIGHEEQAKALLQTFEDNPSVLVDTVCSLMDGPEQLKREVLQTLDPVGRAERVLTELLRIKEVAAAQSSIKNRLESETREHVLRRQLDAIQRELGESEDDDELSRMKAKLDEAPLPPEVRATVDRELKRLQRLGSASPERSVAFDWLEWVSDMPWGKESAHDVDLQKLEEALDKSHYGLVDVKRQVVEHLSVRKLAGSGRADVLLLVGPPGVGKTSIGQAIADATGRKLLRVALGGVRDEAALRGHRRTYIGSRPGRLVEGIRRGGTMDPVILLDEVDKLGQSYQGDPAAALLEILDPEQNHAFTDHYLDVPFDLSKVLFIATANELSTIPAPLRDRMEVLEIAGYTRDEKVVIAKSHLMEKLAKNVGLQVGDVEISDEAVAEAIAGWTREAGVRQLQRTLGRVWREAAVKKAKGELVPPLRVDVPELTRILGRRKIQPEEHDAPNRPGVVTGLAWTPTGGDVLYVEAAALPGRGQLILTGQLGDVMKESARAALTYALSQGSSEPLGERDIHLHVPAGAIPKDGPSAGVTMFTAVTSLLTQRPVRPGIAMTGEATLRGRVLPVGGIKSKVLAAHRLGLTTIILPRKNEADLEDVPKEALADLQIILVDDMNEVIEAALEPAVGKGARLQTQGSAPQA